MLSWVHNCDHCYWWYSDDGTVMMVQWWQVVPDPKCDHPLRISTWIHFMPSVLPSYAIWYFIMKPWFLLKHCITIYTCRCGWRTFTNLYISNGGVNENWKNYSHFYCTNFRLRLRLTWITIIILWYKFKSQILIK